MLFTVDLYFKNLIKFSRFNVRLIFFNDIIHNKPDLLIFFFRVNNYLSWSSPIKYISAHIVSDIDTEQPDNRPFFFFYLYYQGEGEIITIEEKGRGKKFVQLENIFIEHLKQYMLLSVFINFVSMVSGARTVRTIITE